ncbi:hypothetical protein Hypma_000643 [Hypsizygus marmoreus]|uniref:Uncharacterized protein n=1 Tax=Hypsizygus marmoreus TaxID=39966 RepID=A0A369JCE2_HYPMA|nr:hypothetical protein Hypma_000643 [Hypsizygus marmoreus]
MVGVSRANKYCQLFNWIVMQSRMPPPPRHRVFFFLHELRSNRERQQEAKFQVLLGSFAARTVLVERFGGESFDFALLSPMHTSSSTNDPAHHTVRVARTNGNVFIATFHIDDHGALLGKVYFENDRVRVFGRERFMEMY